MFTQSVRILVIPVAVTVLAASAAFAQSPAGSFTLGAPAPASASASGAAAASQAPSLQTAGRVSEWPRGYLVGRGGVTFGTRTAPLLGVEFGGQVAPMLQVYSSFDWHRDIAPGFVEDIGDLVSYIVDADVDYRLPAFTGVGGVKVIAPRGTVRPYGLGGFGFGRVTGKVEIEGDDVTDALDVLGYLDKDDITFTKALFEIGGGVAFSNGRLYADISYRFRKFLQTGEPINMSGVYAGVGVGF